MTSFRVCINSRSAELSIDSLDYIATALTLSPNIEFYENRLRWLKTSQNIEKAFDLYVKNLNCLKKLKKLIFKFVCEIENVDLAKLNQ